MGFSTSKSITLDDMKSANDPESISALKGCPLICTSIIIDFGILRLKSFGFAEFHSIVVGQLCMLCPFLLSFGGLTVFNSNCSSYGSGAGFGEGEFCCSA